MEDKHFPPGAEPEQPATPEPTETPPEAPEVPTEEAPRGDTPQPGEGEAPTEPEAPQDEPVTPPENPKPIKKRTIYDDLKDTRKEKNEFRELAITALKTAGIELQGTESPEQLRALIEQHKPANPPPPAEPAAPTAQPKDELEAFAAENEMDAAALSRLVEIIQKRTPSAQLSEDDKKALEQLQTWRHEQQRSSEDAEVRSHSDLVKKELGISNDTELTNVMSELVRLSHTERFHDKEVGYILWATRADLSKMVSPKKPSFEAGGQPPSNEPEAPKDFSSGKVTPQDAANAMNEDAPRSSYDIRRGTQ